MDKQQWLSELRREFVRRKLPPLYVERLMSELSDHLNDFMEDHMSMDATDLRDAVRPLGLPSQIATAAAHEFRKQHFSGRHPVITFVALPVLALPMLWAAILLGLVAVGKAIARLSGLESTGTTSLSQLPDWFVASLPIIAATIVLAPVIASAAFFCRLAAKAVVNWKWPMLTCFLLAVVGGMAISDVSMPTAGSGGRLVFGFGVRRNPAASQIVQFSVPLAIGALATWRQTRQRRRTLAT